ncbi:MAG: hypothetical protein V1779_14515 [bacterium]
MSFINKTNSLNQNYDTKNNFEDLWTKKNKDILYIKNPLSGIYCVYSMFWVPKEKNKIDEKIIEIEKVCIT